MQNYLFNILIHGNLWMICTFLFRQKNKLLSTTLKLNFNCKKTYRKNEVDLEAKMHFY